MIPTNEQTYKHRAGYLTLAQQNKRKAGEITRQQNTDKIKRYVSNMTKEPANFGFYDSKNQPGMFETWTLGPCIETRDSDCLTQSNAAAIVKILGDKPGLNDTWQINHCSHWAVGWVDHLSYQVVKTVSVLHTTITVQTEVALVMENIKAKLDQYPMLDENDYSQRQHDVIMDNIEDSARMFMLNLDLELPDDHVSKLYQWFSEFDQSAVECEESYPSDEQLKEAFTCLGWYKESEKLSDHLYFEPTHEELADRVANWWHTDDHMLPDLLIQWFDENDLESDIPGVYQESGYYWVACFPGCMPDGEWAGPYDTFLAALHDARGNMECEPPYSVNVRTRKYRGSVQWLNDENDQDQLAKVPRRDVTHIVVTYSDVDYTALEEYIRFNPGTVQFVL